MSFLSNKEKYRREDKAKGKKPSMEYNELNNFHMLVIIKFVYNLPIYFSAV